MSKRYSRRAGSANSDENSELLLLKEIADGFIEAYGTMHDTVDTVAVEFAFVVALVLEVSVELTGLSGEESLLD